jgi:ATP diphosphatase
VRAKIAEELGELDEAVADGDPRAIGEELGDLLFVLTRYASWCKVDAEDALHACIARFEARFYDMEGRAGRPLGDLTPAEMDALWRDAKRRLPDRSAAVAELPKK